MCLSKIYLLINSAEFKLSYIFYIPINARLAKRLKKTFRQGLHQASKAPNEASQRKPRTNRTPHPTHWRPWCPKIHAPIPRPAKLINRLLPLFWRLPQSHTLNQNHLKSIKIAVLGCGQLRNLKKLWNNQSSRLWKMAWERARCLRLEK